MLLQCSINLSSYLVILPIAEKIVLLYCSFSLYKIPARYRYHLRVPSDEPGSKKRCLFRMGDCLFFCFKKAAHQILIVYWQIMDAAFPIYFHVEVQL